MRTPPKLLSPFAALAVLSTFVGPATAQSLLPTAGQPPAPLVSSSPTASASATFIPDAPANRQPIARVSGSNGVLPNDHGQVWREYDISPYTAHAGSGARPEQAIVDWILRETGYEAWHSEPVAILSASRSTLRVYHTPEVQAKVAEIVDRFVNPQAQLQAFSIRVVSVASPNWRGKHLKIMHALPVQSQAVQAWLLTKEDASLLFADLRGRNDFREFSSPTVLVANGQTTTVSTLHPRGYSGSVVLHPEQLHPGFEPQVSQFTEGFSIDFNPLLSLDCRSADAMIRCNVDQLERVVPTTVDVPTALNPRQHTDIEIPQTASYRLRERFHWPTDQVLLISFGIVAAPLESQPTIRLSFSSGPPRAEMLAFIETRGVAANPVATVLPNALPAATIPARVQPLAPTPGPAPSPIAARRDPFYRSPY